MVFKKSPSTLFLLLATYHFLCSPLHSKTSFKSCLHFTSHFFFNLLNIKFLSSPLYGTNWSMSTTSPLLKPMDTAVLSLSDLTAGFNKVGSLLKAFSSSFWDTTILCVFFLHHWLLPSIFFWLLPQQTSNKEVFLGAHPGSSSSFSAVSSIPYTSNTINRLTMTSYISA